MGQHPLRIACILLASCLATGCALSGDFGSYRLGSPSAFVVELDEQRDSVRLLDLPIFTLFEYRMEKDPGRLSLGFLETPLFKVFSRRDEGRQAELRVLDFRLLAIFRKTRNGREEKLHVVKLPFLGSIYGFETDGKRMRRNVLFLTRETDVPPPPPAEPEPEPEPTPETAPPAAAPSEPEAGPPQAMPGGEESET